MIKVKADKEINVKPRYGSGFVILEGLSDETMINALLRKIGLANM
ncbi:MAG: hypothetical protein QXU32_10310 [Nitrososphaerales archaeon]